MYLSFTLLLLTNIALSSMAHTTGTIYPNNADPADTVKTSSPIVATVNLNSEAQTIDGFGASDCWHIKYVGRDWPEAKRNAIADLLFSKEVDAYGNPKGIGLSIWRSNIGAGSFEQGAASQIASPARREECFQKADGSYDWTKQKGNQWFAKAAKQRGVEKFLLFSIAPPVHMSKNGLAFNDSGKAVRGTLNLKPDKYGEYAAFMAYVAQYYNSIGAKVDYISPVNETNWDWVAKGNGLASQEGTAATNEEVFMLTKSLDSVLRVKNLTTKITVCESGAHRHTVGFVKNEPKRSDFINYFWNPLSKGYLGHFSSVQKIISSHSYFSNESMHDLITYRQKIAARIHEVNKDVSYWQSEYCILGNEDGIKGPGRDLGMKTALYVARVIHTDLVIGGASSWQWWLGVTTGDYKDGLIYLTSENNETEADLKHNGKVNESKLLWAVGNYARFVRPGMKRIDLRLQGFTDSAAVASGIMLSAYKHDKHKQVVVVMINNQPHDININLDGIDFANEPVKLYTTSDTASLHVSEANAKLEFALGKHSVVTLVGSYK